MLMVEKEFPDLEASLFAQAAKTSTLDTANRLF
jgi:hypothetical protein